MGMTSLRIATCENSAESLHAAAVGAAVTVCGRRPDVVSDLGWDTQPDSSLCPRCSDAVAVLRLVRAV